MRMLILYTKYKISWKTHLNGILNIPCILKWIQYLGRALYVFFFLVKIMDAPDLILPWFFITFLNNKSQGQNQIWLPAV